MTVEVKKGDRIQRQTEKPCDSHLKFPLQIGQLVSGITERMGHRTGKF